MSHAIEVHDVSKRFRLNTERHSSLKERAVRLGRRRPAEEFWALSGIDFDVEQGQTVGLLGHNGSGKSTLLKCIGSILRPTSGEIRTWGRMASLLELGAGFHPDLTGRENVYLNASILGLSKRDTDARFDEIVAFAELERFIDQQVKHYSSGMYVRLGFSVATSVDPEILLVDEVLAVGDEAFQQKCLERIKTFQRDGRTIVFVTHGADLVRQICDRVVVLDQGRQVIFGEPSEAVRAFREGLYHVHEGGHDGEPAADGSTSERFRIVSVDVVYPEPTRPFVRTGEPLEVRVAYEAYAPLDNVDVALTAYSNDGHLVHGQSTGGLVGRLPLRAGRGEITFRYERLGLLEGRYPLTIVAHGGDGGEVFDWREQYDHIVVANAEDGSSWGVADLRLSVDLSEADVAATATPATGDPATGATVTGSTVSAPR